MMKQFNFFCLLFFALLQHSYGQKMKVDQFNKRYLDVVVSLVAIDIKEAERVADSLRRVASTDEQKIKVYMLWSKLYENKGEMQQSVQSAMRADTIANATMNFSWQATTSGSLATSFRQLGLLKASESFLKKAEAANENQADPTMKMLTSINILHERAFHSFVLGNYLDAKRYVQKASVYIHRNANDDKKALLIKATNDQLMGICALNLGELVAADSFLNSSFAKIEGVESNLKPYIYRAQAEVALARNDLKNAKKYLDLVQPYLESGNVEELSMLTHETLSKYYKEIGDENKSLHYRSLFIDLKEKRDNVAKSISDDLIENLNERKFFYRNRLILALGGITVILLLAIGGMLFFYEKQRNYRKKYVDLIEKQRTKAVISSPQIKTELLLNERIENVGNIKPKDVNMSKETEDRLYQLLLKKEAELFYLEKGVTLSQLAADMGTNSRYVTYIIQKFKGKDFYDYLQTRRIDYIVDKIRTSPELLDFKLSYLADMCGFASLSKFSSSFKSVTGMPPSAFVHFVKMEMEQYNV
ncbi:Helix-turn-helix domain protein [compost metagenome]